ncbi:glucose 1-dehydrogenase [Nocardioides sambongensis]|uniref:glucose 1-dehydrogenase n=1 Tax=Nocardioides sambongensis TaxID=2589074 RepID=UPI0011293936|nr:glucose 1-dehydrogenase [Nocardioides sambongensis]
MGTLESKVVLLTGGARGMGAAHARHFVEEGARVVIGDLLDHEGELLAKELGERARYVHHDVTDPTSWAGFVSTATAEFGRVDGLVNNAGVLVFQPIAEMDLDAFRRVLEINLTGTWLGIKTVAPLMSEQGGSIVNVSSINGMVGASGLSAYTASKFGVRGLTKAAAHELGSQGIRVNSIHPGGIATPMTQRPGQPPEGEIYAKVPISRWGQPEEVSPLASYLLSDQSTYCTGSEFTVDGGMLSGAGL